MSACSHWGELFMAEIFDKEWDSLTRYDEELMKIRHYQLHPEMLPYIGRHYPNTGILVLGESHYLSNEESDETRRMQGWYDRTTQSGSFKHPRNFYTRGVVRTYLTERRYKSSSMFSNPAKALIDGWGLECVNDSEAFTAFAFFNYFQRPASSSGASISLNAEDEVQACAILSRVLGILQPQKVIFLSKKAFNSYSRLAGTVDRDLIDYVYHPTSKYWNYADGGEKLRLSFRAMTPYAGLARNGSLKLNNAKQLLAKTPYLELEKKQHRFRDGIVTYRIYLDEDDGTSVKEIAWYLKEAGRRFGIGYLVQSRILWAWDYSAECFFNPGIIESATNLSELYRDILHLISSL